MTADDRPDEPAPPDDGGLAPASGTAVPVDVERDRRARRAWVMFLGGPVIWITHFLLVYLIAEAGCTGDGALLERFDPPVPVVATWLATLVALPAAAAMARWAWRSWRGGYQGPVDLAPESTGPSDDRGELIGSPLAFAGFLLSALSVIAILFTAAPALVLSCSG